MRKFVIAITIICALSLSAFALQEEQVPVQDATEQVQETPTSSKVILFGMTAVAVILLGLSFRNSKWGKKK